MQCRVPRQAWLDEFIAKEKEVNGVKDEDGEAAAETQAADGAASPAAASAEPAADKAAAEGGARRT